MRGRSLGFFVEPKGPAPSFVEVCARWCPTLPHPGGCSTIGAVRLSYPGSGWGRAFPCRCDHRDDYVGSASVCSCDSVIGRPVNAHCVLVVGLGVDRIVDARILFLPPTHLL